MDTMTDTLTSIEISASTALDLFAGAAVIADNKQSKNLPVLYSVYLSAADSRLTLKASDRYRLIVGDTDATISGRITDAAISLPDTQRLIKFVKDSSKHNGFNLFLTIAGNMLTATIGSDSLTLPVELGITTPLNNESVDKLLNAPMESVAEIGVSAAYIASFNKVPGDNGRLGLKFRGNKQIQIEISHATIQWTALLMPMRAGK